MSDPFGAIASHLDIGYQVPNIGHQITNIRYRISDIGYKMSDLFGAIAGHLAIIGFRMRELSRPGPSSHPLGEM